jgi:NADH-quinone oxidoreductase subunit E
MLTDQERAHLQDHIAAYPERRAGALYTLQFLQRKAGYLSDEAVNEAAHLTGLSATQLDELITFYTLLHRRPTGKHMIRICDSIACHLAGAGELLSEAERILGVRLGDNSRDGAVTVVPSICLGLCDRAPAALVDESAAGPLDTPGLESLIADFRKET